jgi:hypothetical protein
MPFGGRYVGTMLKDSTIVLAWISACPTKWKTFVANRVAEIQEIATNVSSHKYFFPTKALDYRL